MRSNVLYSFITAAALVASTTLSAQWIQLGSGNDPLPSSNLRIQCIAHDGAGNIYAAGSFLDGANDHNVRKYNGSTWTTLGTLNASADILALCSDPAGNIYASGKFLNGSATAYVAKWDGSNWTEVGAGQKSGAYLSQSIRSLVSDGHGNIFAAGEMVDSTFAHYLVTKWDGSHWSTVGALNANAGIEQIVMDGSNNIYAAGEFRNGGGSRYVAKWNGSTWSELGGGALNLNGDAYALAVSGPNVYVAGDFTDAQSGYYVARWNGSSWSELGAGLSTVSAINKLATDDGGNVYAAGDFGDMNGNEYVAKWNGSGWSDFGHLNGNSTINALMYYNHKLYSGGLFGNASGNTYVAVLNVTTGINELEGSACKMYPNPVSNVCKLEFTKAVTGTVSLCDVTGHEISSWMLSDEKEKTLALGSYAAGIYLVRIESNTGESRSLKLIKE